MNPMSRVRPHWGAVLIAIGMVLVGCGGAAPTAQGDPSLLPATWTPAIPSSTPFAPSEPVSATLAPADTQVSPEVIATTEVTETAEITETGEITETSEITVTATPAPLGEEVIFPIEADTQVREFEPGLNFGGETTLRADGGDDPTFESYLRVTVAGVTGPVARARLRVFAETGSDAGLSIYGTSNEWSETELNWDNRPPRALNPLGVIQEEVLGQRWVEFDVTPAITGNGTYSFVIGLDASNGLAMTSREGDPANAPQLVVEVANNQ